MSFSGAEPLKEFPWRSNTISSLDKCQDEKKFQSPVLRSANCFVIEDSIDDNVIRETRGL
jgi:hypothetical protein